MSEDLGLVLAQAIVAAFAAAAAVVLLCGSLRRAPRPTGIALGTLLGIGLGFYAGCRILAPFPTWPPKVDQHRLLLIVFPAVLAVEAVATLVRKPRLLIGLLRAVVVVGAARVLLHNIRYLTDLSGPGTAEWTSAMAMMVFGGLAAALGIVW